MGITSTIDRVRALFKKSESSQDYEPLYNDGDEDVRRPVLIRPDTAEAPFSWLEYSIFLILGVAMLWAW
jgi:equilibrative nucleoside transporter 1/2/3